jgi:hypothetical protein
MKILKSIGSLLIIACGAYVSYLAFLAYDLGNWTRTGIFLCAALLCLCFGIVTLLLALSRKPSDKTVESAMSEIEPVAPDSPLTAEELFIREDRQVAEPRNIDAEIIAPGAGFTEETNSDEAAELDYVSQERYEPEEENELIEGMAGPAGQEPTEIKKEEVEPDMSEDMPVPIVKPEPVGERQPAAIAKAVESPKTKAIVETIEDIDFPKFKTHLSQVEIKEDPQLLFGDWWVDENGLYIDMRLIGISGRKQQKVLKKLAVNTKLEYHVNSKNDAIEIVFDKVVIGMVPELYLHSLLMYIQGIENIKAESIVKKGRDIVQCTVKVRFDDDLREKLQKKLQQKTWQ